MSGPHPWFAIKPGLAWSLLVWIPLAGMALGAMGCRGTTVFSFGHNPERLEPRGPVLLVAPVSDSRDTDPGEGWAHILIPLVGVATLTTPRPDTDPHLDLSAPVGVREALQQLASESRIFSEVVADTDDIESPGRVLTLDATLEDLSLERQLSAYRLGFVAIPFWLMGLPNGRITSAVRLRVRLSNSLGDPLWQATLMGSRARLRGWYFNNDWRPAMVEDLEQILRTEWARVVEDLGAVVLGPGQ